MTSTPTAGGGEEPYAFAVEDVLPAAWPEQLAGALATWRQGDGIVAPGFTWLAPAAPDPVTGATGGAEDWEPFSTAGGLRSTYGVVCSQTCDIATSGPGRVHPFVDVCPAVDLGQRSESYRLAVQRLEIVYMVPLTRSPEPGSWAADLRIVVPVSKALLATQHRVQLFASEADRLGFAEALAGKHRRPALHEALSEAAPRDLDAYIKENRGKLANGLGHVDHVRFVVTNDRLQPSTVQYFVVEQTRLEESQRAVWRGWDSRGGKILKRYGIDLYPTQFQSLDEMSARAYRASMPLRLTQLRRPPSW